MRLQVALTVIALASVDASWWWWSRKTTLPPTPIPTTTLPSPETTPEATTTVLSTISPTTWSPEPTNVALTPYPTQEEQTTTPVGAIREVQDDHDKQLATQPPAYSVNWHPCLFVTSSNVSSSDTRMGECADVKLPFCYPGICDSNLTISIFVKRLAAVNASSTKQALWMIQGGPGSPSVGLEAKLLKEYDLSKGTRSVYTSDHRGTGRSEMLVCPQGDMNPSDNVVDYYRECFKGLNAKYGPAAASGFSVTSAANDIVSIIESSLSHHDVYLYGFSYGTYVAERIMHLAPKNIKGYILDSIQSEQFYKNKDAPYYSNWDRDVGGVVTQFFHHCDQDAFCASKIGPNSRSTLKSILENLDTLDSMCTDVLKPATDAGGVANPSEVVGQKLYEWIQSQALRVFIPAYIYRIGRCNGEDQTWLRRVHGLDHSNQNGRDSSNLIANGRSDLLYKLIVYSELWESPTPALTDLMKWSEDALISLGNDDKALKDTINYCLFTGSSTSECADLDALNPHFSYERDLYWNKTATIPFNASVLFFTGGLDPATPAKYALDEIETMAGSSKLLVEFPYCNHIIFDHTPVLTEKNVDCGVSILNSYLNHNGNVNLVNTSCVAQVATLNFSVWQKEYSQAYFASDSPYEQIAFTTLSPLTLTTSPLTQSNISQKISTEAKESINTTTNRTTSSRDNLVNATMRPNKLHNKTFAANNSLNESIIAPLQDDPTITLPPTESPSFVTPNSTLINETASSTAITTIDSPTMPSALLTPLTTALSNATRNSTTKVNPTLNQNETTILPSTATATPFDTNATIPNQTILPTEVTTSLPPITSAPLTPLPPITIPDVALNWYPCSMTTTAFDDPSILSNSLPAECADVSVPLCHPGVCHSDQYISIFVKRLRSKSWTTGTPALWFVPGGPGLPSTGLEETIVQIYQQSNDAFDIYTMDPRGTGRSPLLDCADDTSDLDTLAVCLQKIKASYGEDAPAIYSVTSAAADLRLILHSSLFANSEVFIYGVSFGTYLVERLMHFAPAIVKGYILDSVVSESFGNTSPAYFSHGALNIHDVVTAFFKVCDADSFCSDKLGADSQDALRRVFQDIDAKLTQCATALEPIATAAGFSRVSELVGQTLYGWLKDRELRAFIPAAIYRLERCNEADIEWAKQWKAPGNHPTIIEYKHGPYLSGIGVSSTIFETIVFSEFWEDPSPSADMISQWTHVSYLSQGYELAVSTSINRLCLFKHNSDTNVCTGLPDYNVSFVYPRDIYWNNTAAVPAGASVLLFSGGLDVLTPSKFAQAQFDAMEGSNKLLLQFPTAGHTILTNTIVEVAGDDIEDLVDCGTSILLSYVQHHGLLQSTDTSCISHVQTLNFENYDRDVAFDLFQTEEPYANTDDANFQATLPWQLRFKLVPSGLALMILVCGAVLATIITRRHLRQRERPAYIPMSIIVDSYGTVAY